MPAGLDSVSFAATLLGRPEEQASHEFLYWEFHERTFRQAALYDGRWKGMRVGLQDAPVALYDLDNDVAEQKDVSAQNPEIAEKISNYLKTARTENPNWVPKWGQ